MAKNKIIYGNTTLIDLTDATLGQNDGDQILSGQTFYGASGTKQTGSMTNQGGVSGTISDVNTPYTIAQGYHDGSGSVSIDNTESAKIIPNNIKDGVQILGVTGTYTGEGVTAQTKSATPYTTAQTILPDANYDYLAEVDIAAIYYNETANAYGTTVTIGTVDPNA